jgi:hypothetical protein
MQTQPNSQHTLLYDVYVGAVHGDFAPVMGGAGRLTQVILGFIPGIGNVCALRDLMADWRLHDHTGVLLNGLAIIPVIGGFSKMAAVLRATRRMSKALRAARALKSPVPTSGNVTTN